MSSNLTPEQRENGKRNFEQLVGHWGVTRRDFMKGLLAAGTAVPITAALYFGYESLKGKPIKVGLIGAGDQGGVLVGEHNPEYLRFIGYCDLRPSNQERIFTGESTGPRKGFLRVYGADARHDVLRYDTYRELLHNKDIEAVVIALPLHLHAAVAVDAMRAGKHVFCEKLMAWSIEECKRMMRVARETKRVLAIGHQRHYSLLYAHAVEVLGSLGTIKHIRATWHRNNTLPRKGPDGKELRDPRTGSPIPRDSWRPDVAEMDRKALEGKVRELGYESVEELVRWRLYNRSSGGIMAELGSHQLDAASLFLGGARPLSVTGFGGKIYFRDEREVDDHVFATLEYPGPRYYAEDGATVNDRNDVVIVTFSSLSTNASEPYGETLFGTEGTMIVEAENHVMLFPERGAGAGKWMTATVTQSESGKPVLEAGASAGPVERTYQERGQAALGSGSLGKGYREELEHFAYCVRAAGDRAAQPRCDGMVGLRNAVSALMTNQALREKRRIEFRDSWFDPDQD